MFGWHIKQMKKQVKELIKFQNELMGDPELQKLAFNMCDYCGSKYESKLLECPNCGAGAPQSEKK